VNFWDLVPFLSTSGLALIFTVLLILVVQDDSNDSKVLDVQQRFVELSGKEREWSMRSQSSYYGDSPVQRNATGSRATVTVTAQPSPHQQFPKRLFGAYLSRLVPIRHRIYVPVRPSVSLILDPIALPPSPRRPSPTQAPSAARMLSLVKLTMHRHVRIAFPFVHLVHITSRLLIALFPMTP